MATYQNMFLGDSGESIDVYTETLIGGVTYAVGALGASNGGTLADPAVAIFDSQSNLLAYELDTWYMGEDPLLQWTAPASGTYQIAVWDELGGTGSYTLSVEPPGPSPFLDPTDFGTFGN